MLNAQSPAARNQALIGFTLFLLAVFAAWELGTAIVAGEMRVLEFVAVGFAACIGMVAILRNWRTGFYLFLVWLLLEDLVRKYMGNSPLLFFGKDILAALVYISLFADMRRRGEKLFRPPFFIFLVIFIWLGVMQIFNPHSPHILYGLLGFKLYFYYIPLMYAGYALLRNDRDLRKFLMANALFAAVVAGLGIAQAILGNSFLNPATLTPELQDLADLYKVTPLSGQTFSLPDSVFVSSGRYDLYLVIAICLIIGAAGYLVIQKARGRGIIFAALGILGMAVLLCGSRGAVVYALASLLVLSVGFLWGAPRRQRQRQGGSLAKVIRRTVVVASLGLAAILLLFPEQAGSRIAYYTETMLPSSSAYQVTNRAWDYPIQSLKNVFLDPNWVLGNGIGTGSLGTQYVSELTHVRPLKIFGEEGYATLILEMGIVAPFLWLLWTGALLYFSWKVVRSLRETPYFPIAIAVFWYAFILLYPLTYGGLAPYQNYLCNAFLWLLVGILFRLPALAQAAESTAPAGA